MQLQLSTWTDIEAYLQRSDAILLPIGSTEQHGPNGPLGTDAICPDIIAAEAARRTGLLVAPTLPLGMAQHHLGFPGTISLRPATLMALVRDTVQSLSLHGLRSFCFVNGHGGNIATLHAAFAELNADRGLRGDTAPWRCHLHSWYLGRQVRALSRELFGESEGSHATPSEISLAWHAQPQAERPMQLAPRPRGERGFRDAADFRQRYPDGRIGSDPSLASAAHGARILEAAVSDLLQHLEDIGVAAPGTPRAHP